MKIAALILGILAGLSGLPVATMGHALVGAGGGSGGAVLYLLPLASFLGAGLALNLPAASAGLLVASALFWFLLGAQAGYGINIITISTVLLNSVGGLLAFIGWAQNSSAARGVQASKVAQTRGTVSPTPVKEPAQYDRDRWEALLKYDDEIATVATKLQPLGQRWLDEFAKAYLSLNDKSYLPNIVQKIIADARNDELYGPKIAQSGEFRGQSWELFSDGHVKAKLKGRIAEFKSMSDFQQFVNDNFAHW